MTAPRSRCCCTKKLPALLILLIEMNSVSATIISVTSVSGTLRMIIEVSTLIIVTTLETSCVIDWEIIWRMVSMSLV